MRNTKKPLANALQQLSIACDLLGLDYPVLEIDINFALRLYRELEQMHIVYDNKEKSYYGIQLKLKKKEST